MNGTVEFDLQMFATETLQQQVRGAINNAEECSLHLTKLALSGKTIPPEEVKYKAWIIRENMRELIRLLKL